MAEYYELFCSLAFWIQLIICFKVRNVWIRMMPQFLILGSMAVTAGLYLVKGELYYMAYLIIWGLILLSSEFAWIVYAVVKLLKKRKNNL